MPFTRINQRSSIQTIGTRQRTNEGTNVFASLFEVCRQGTVWAWLGRHAALEKQCCTHLDVCRIYSSAAGRERQTDRQRGRQMTRTIRMRPCAGGESVVWWVGPCMTDDGSVLRSCTSPRPACAFETRLSLSCVPVHEFRVSSEQISYLPVSDRRLVILNLCKITASNSRVSI